MSVDPATWRKALELGLVEAGELSKFVALDSPRPKLSPVKPIPPPPRPPKAAPVLWLPENGSWLPRKESA